VAKMSLVAKIRYFEFLKIVMETTMTTTDTAKIPLKWDVLTIKRPGLSRDLPPGKEKLM
jgi:hypothetical protein